MSLLKKNTIRKKQVEVNLILLKFEAGNSNKYKVEAIQDSAVYVRKSESYLPGLYYLVL